MKSNILLLIIALGIIRGYAQTPEQNMMKYWKHRQQLSQFVWKGADVNATTEHGSYLVAAFKKAWANCAFDSEFGNTSGSGMITQTLYSNRCGGLKFGADATIQLGWYIGVLATEYRLAKNHSFPTSEIERDLWGALEAYERLDRMAEGLYEGHEPELNGFFLRDDIMPWFAVDKVKSDGSPYFEGIGCSAGSFAHGIVETDPNDIAIQNNPTTDPWDVTVTDGANYVNTPSADQVVALMLGFALVKACVDNPRPAKCSDALVEEFRRVSSME